MGWRECTGQSYTKGESADGARCARGSVCRPSAAARLLRRVGAAGRERGLVNVDDCRHGGPSHLGRRSAVACLGPYLISPFSLEKCAVLAALKNILSPADA